MDTQVVYSTFLINVLTFTDNFYQASVSQAVGLDIELDGVSEFMQEVSRDYTHRQ